MSKKITQMEIDAAEEIFDDLTGRCGIGNALEECDSDIQQEIKDTMAKIIAKHTSKIVCQG